MARFLGAVRGRKGAVTRLGSAPSGINAAAQGWNSGVTVRGFARGDEDEFHIFATGGSNAAVPERYLGTVKLVGDRIAFIQA